MLRTKTTIRETEDNLKKVAAALDTLKLDYKEGATYVTLSCPFSKTAPEHKGADRHPSFTIFVNYGFAKCYTCGYRAGILEFLEQYARMTNNPADFEYFEYWQPEQREETENIVLDEDILNVFEESEKVNEYFFSRDIDLSGTPLKFLYHNQKKRVVFPLRDEYNNLMGATARSTEQTNFKTYHYFGVKTSKCLAGFEHRANNKILVVEGLADMANAYDKCRCLEHKFDIYATLTASLSKWQALKLIDEDKPIFMAFDMDDAGRKGQYKALKLLDDLGAATLVNVSWKKQKDVGGMDYDLFNNVFGD